MNDLPRVIKITGPLLVFGGPVRQSGGHSGDPGGGMPPRDPVR